MSNAAILVPQVGSVQPAVAIGLDRDLPAPGVAGRIYQTTDAGVQYVDTGAAWRVVSALSSTACLGGFTDGLYLGGAAGAAIGPIGGPGYSFAVALYVTVLPGTTGRVVWAYNTAGGAAGWHLSGSGAAANTMAFNLAVSGVNQTIQLPGAALALGAHKLAFALLADGLSCRYAFDGVLQAAVATTIGVNYTPPGVTSAHYIGRWVVASLANNFADLGELVAWNAVLSDADLVAVTAAPANLRITGDAATRAFGWAARHHLPNVWVKPYGPEAVAMAAIPTATASVLTLTDR
jgi:hypothetical protein